MILNDPCLLVFMAPVESSPMFQDWSVKLIHYDRSDSIFLPRLGYVRHYGCLLSFSLGYGWSQLPCESPVKGPAWQGTDAFNHKSEYHLETDYAVAVRCSLQSSQDSTRLSAQDGSLKWFAVTLLAGSSAGAVKHSVLAWPACVSWDFDSIVVGLPNEGS